ncbi:MAG TPA: alpha-amylase family glycosyl hydrolase [Pyrinomonadaceae bacterium]
MRNGTRQFEAHALVAALAVFVLSCAPTFARQGRDVSRENARSTAPAWVRAGVIYEIYPRQFSEAGNFAGVTAQLDRLKELGVNILWLMPVHPIGQEKKKGPVGSPYAVRDYYAVNPDYGTAADLKRLVAEAHRRGLKVIIDIVANPTSWDSVMMKTPEFYVRDASGKITYPHDWSDVAELNYDNPALRRYMIDMLKFWLREYDMDGFRCDVAGEVPTDFWEQARVELDKVKPGILLLAESDKPELLVRAFDLDYSWPLHGTLNDVMTGRKPASAFRETWEADAAKYPRGALRMRFSDNHDERRAVARFGEGGALAASALMLTLDGVPMLYNGMEVGDTTESGDPALFYKLPVFWPIEKRRPEFPRFYRQMIALRKSHPAFTRGSLAWLNNSDDSRVVAFARRDEGEEVLVAVNFSNRPFDGTLDTPAGAPFEDITPDTSGLLNPDLTEAERAARARRVTLPALTLDPWGYRIFRRKR